MVPTMRGRATKPRILTLSAVEYALIRLPSSGALLRSARRAVVAEYHRLGRHGQGESFPEFTEAYLQQTDTLRAALPADLLAWFALCAQVFLRHLAPRLPIVVTPRDLHPLWANVHTAGQFHIPHTHALSECLLSGVFYVSAPSRGGGGLLTLESSAVPPIGGPFDRVYKSSHYVTIPPVPGWLVLFPPFVRHHVTPHASRSPRISLAFNVTSDVARTRSGRGR